VNGTVDLHSSDVPRPVNRDAINSTSTLKVAACVLQSYYDDEHDKTMFHNTTPDLQDQDQDQYRLFVLRPVLS